MVNLTVAQRGSLTEYLLEPPRNSDLGEALRYLGLDHLDEEEVAVDLGETIDRCSLCSTWYEVEDLVFRDDGAVGLLCPNCYNEES